MTLAWQGPERPKGEIVEYEVIYYEKVRKKNTNISSVLCSKYKAKLVSSNPPSNLFIAFNKKP